MKNKKRRKKKWVLPVVLLIVAVGGFFLVRGMFFSTAAVVQSVEIDAKPLIKSDISEIISASGSVYSNSVENVYSTLSYPVKQIDVEVGDIVKQGEILAILDTKNLQYDIAQAEINLTSAQSTYEDNRQNVSSGIVSAENSVKTAKISMEKQELNYNNLVEQSDINSNTELINAQNQIDSARDAVTSAKTSIDSAQSAKADAQKDLDDKLKLLETSAALLDAGLISQSEFDTAQSNVDKARRELEKAETTLSNASTSHDTALRNLDKAEKNADISHTSVSKSLQTAAKDLESARISYQNSLDALAKARGQNTSGSNIDGQKLSLEKLKNQLSDANIKAPIDGVITSVSAVVGSNPNGVMFVVQDTGDLYVKTTVKEYSLSHVKLGQDVKITTDATGDEIFMGKVSYISPVAVSEAGNTSVEFEVRAKLDKPSSMIKVGMNAYVNIIVDSRSNVYSVPADAIISEKDDKYILAMDNGARSKIQVETGLETATAVEISGKSLKDGLIVIQNPAEVQAAEAAGIALGGGTARTDGGAASGNSAGGPGGMRVAIGGPR